MELEITNRIFRNEKYRKLVAELAELEKYRRFCRHDIEHFFDVARIMMILCTRRKVEISEDIVYSAALLHDLGRIQEITAGIPHEMAGQITAAGILADVDCPEDMAEKIISLIANHRRKDNPEDSPEQLFFTADKRSRKCFLCKACDECNWVRKNMEIEV